MNGEVYLDVGVSRKRGQIGEGCGQLHVVDLEIYAIWCIACAECSFGQVDGSGGVVQAVGGLMPLQSEGGCRGLRGGGVLSDYAVLGRNRGLGRTVLGVAREEVLHVGDLVDADGLDYRGHIGGESDIAVELDLEVEGEFDGGAGDEEVECLGDGVAGVVVAWGVVDVDVVEFGHGDGVGVGEEGGVGVGAGEGVGEVGVGGEGVAVGEGGEALLIVGGEGGFVADEPDGLDLVSVDAVAVGGGCGGGGCGVVDEDVVLDMAIGAYDYEAHGVDEFVGAVGAFEAVVVAVGVLPGGILLVGARCGSLGFGCGNGQLQVDVGVGSPGVGQRLVATASAEGHHCR